MPPPKKPKQRKPKGPRVLNYERAPKPPVPPSPDEDASAIALRWLFITFGLAILMVVVAVYVINGWIAL